LKSCQLTSDLLAIYDVASAWAVEAPEAKLAEAVEALDEAVYLLNPDEEDMLNHLLRRITR